MSGSIPGLSTPHKHPNFQKKTNKKSQNFGNKKQKKRETAEFLPPHAYFSRRPININIRMLLPE